MPSSIAIPIEGRRAPGSGLPSGGDAGQILRKNSSAPFDASWAGEAAVEISNPEFSVPPADGKNVLFYRFSTGALLTDSGDHAAGPFTLDGTNQGSLTQDDSAEAVFGKLLTGVASGGSTSDRLSCDPGAGNFLDGADFADGITFYVRFRTPAAGELASYECAPLFAVKTASGAAGAYGTSSRIFAGIANDGGLKLVFAISSDDNAHHLLTIPGPFDPETEHCFAFSLSGDSSTYEAALDGTTYNSGATGLTDVISGWTTTTDAIEVGGATGAVTGLGYTKKAIQSGGVDEILIRNTVDGPLIAFDGTYTPTVARAPVVPTEAGTPGHIAYDGGYLYVCTAANTWKRAALGAW